jgi:uncharacterized protein YjbI with pentapeptide repeats
MAQLTKARLTGQILLMLSVLCLAISWLPLPVAAQDYPLPLSYSNAQLKGKDFAGQTLRAAEFSNANLEGANFSGADLRGAIFSGSAATETNFEGADFTTGMLDVVTFNRANLRAAVLVDTILLRAKFSETNITGADFSGALLDGGQIRQLCAIATGTNPQTGVDTRASLGCRD